MEIDDGNEPLTNEGVTTYLMAAGDAMDDYYNDDPDHKNHVVQLASAMMVADGLRNVAHALVLLGHAGAVTDNGNEIGAIEGLSMQIKEGLTDVADAIEHAEGAR